MEKPRHSVPEFCIVHECDIVAAVINTQYPTATLQLSSTQRCNVKDHPHALTPCYIVKADHSHVSEEIQHILHSFNENF